MTSAQKIIKYFALTIAVFLVINIFSAIAFGIYTVAGIVSLGNSKSVNTEEILSNYENDIAVLDINLKYSVLTIKSGEYLKAETNNKYIEAKQDKNKLVINENNHNWFSKHNNSELIVYVPKYLEFEKISINTGAGKISIKELITKSLSFEMGAGKVDIDNLYVSNKATIEGGAGNFNISNGEINNLDLDMGVGKTSINANIIGKSKINSGIGSLNVSIPSNFENYKVNINKGLGTIKVNGEDVNDGDILGNGDNTIDIDGGIGNIELSFSSKSF